MDYDTQLIPALSLGLLATGGLAGTLAGLLGVGGGIVIVPVLYWLFDLLDVAPEVAMHMAVATSLCTIIPTSISSARAHGRRGAIDMDLLKIWAPAIFAGAFAGGLLSKVLGSSGLTVIFGVIALLVAINMAIPRTLIIAPTMPRGPLGLAALPSGIGGISALMGIGGGTLSVPVLSAFSFPVHRAIGTASAFGLVIAVPAVCGFIWSGLGVPDRPPLSLGYVCVPAAVMILTGSVLTAPIGARLAHSMDASRLKIAFAAFLFLTSIKMLWTVSNAVGG